MLTEVEILDRYTQSLGEAKRACQYLGKNADPEYLALRGGHYSALKASLGKLEGCARQMSHYRSDARWLKLGILYAKTMRVAQAKFVGQRWAAFTEMIKIFELGLREMKDLRERPTGVRGPILPSRASEWLILPDYSPPALRGPMH